MKLKEITDLIEAVAPTAYQESYDNSGLLLGHPGQEVRAVLLSLDCTEAVVEEAIQKGCDLILCHHPLIFKGLKRINGKNDVERTVIRAIQAGIAVYAAHTNLDNVLHRGVSQKLALKIGLESLQILQPKAGFLAKLQIYIPAGYFEAVRTAVFEAGAGQIGQYSECSFSFQGEGSFKPGDAAQPFVGNRGIREQAAETRLEVLAPAHLAESIIAAARARHPYEEMAYEILPLSNVNQELGSGVVGDLPASLPAAAFLDHVRNSLGLQLIRHTAFTGAIKKVAVCGGSGSFLLPAAIRAGADAYLTGDVKYHDFFDAVGKLMFCDIGHYESEISTLEVFYEVIREKMPNFAIHFCETSTNPIHYHK